MNPSNSDAVNGMTTKGGIRSKTRTPRPLIGAFTDGDRVQSWTVRSLSTNAVEDPRSAPFHLCQPGTHPGDALFVEGLRMAQPNETPDNKNHGRDSTSNGQRADNEQHQLEVNAIDAADVTNMARATTTVASGDVFAHRPVMVDEVVAMFADVPAGVVVDATLGGAGHAAALLASRPDLKILGLDRDGAATAASSGVLAGAIANGRARISNVRFDAMASAAATAFPGEPVVGVLFDLGVSSPQLDWATRGFSYRMQGPLDMRMDVTQALSADDVVNGYDLNLLTDILRDGGEEKFARRVARAIVDARPITDTLQLAEVARSAIPAPARRRPGDPAKRTFQAVRIEVNQELTVLREALDIALELLDVGGRIVTIAYHSGEDRIIKQRFVAASTGGCNCPPALPCMCGAKATHRVLTRGARKPTTAEISANSRAKSARLRAAEALTQNSDNGEGDGRTSHIGGTEK